MLEQGKEHLLLEILDARIRPERPFQDPMHHRRKSLPHDSSCVRATVEPILEERGIVQRGLLAVG